MTDLSSEAGAGGLINGTLQAEMFAIQGGGKSKTDEKGKRRPAYGNGLKAPSPIGKNFVLDTNVLLHDPDCLDRFADNHVCIPLEVLCELDKFKNEQTERGGNARSVHRKLAGLFSKHPETATTGIPTREGGSVRLVPAQPGASNRSVVIDELLDLFRGQESNDNRILVQIVGVDLDYREYGKSGDATDELLKDLPAGATVRVKILALNGSLEALDGPVAEILVG